MTKPLPWLRVYTDAYRHPKLRRLSDKLHRFWFGCLCLAGEHGGVLPEVADIACYLVMPEPRVAEYLGDLRIAGLFDETEHGTVPHNWNDRQYRSDVSTERVKRFRKRRETVSETAPDTDTEQRQNRTEQKRVVSMPTFEKDRLEAWQWFRSEFPSEIHEDHDCQVFMSVIQIFEDIAALRRNLPLWKASEQWQKGYIHSAENFLRKGIFKTAPKARSPTGEYKYTPPDNLLTDEVWEKLKRKQRGEDDEGTKPAV